jgi:hypothetical protein
MPATGAVRNTAALFQHLVPRQVGKSYVSARILLAAMTLMTHEIVQARIQQTVSGWAGEEQIC